MTANKMECRRENEIEQTGLTSKQQQERSTVAKERAMKHHIATTFTYQDGDAYLKHL